MLFSNKYDHQLGFSLHGYAGTEKWFTASLGHFQSGIISEESLGHHETEVRVHNRGCSSDTRPTGFAPEFPVGSNQKWRNPQSYDISVVIHD